MADAAPSKKPKKRPMTPARKRRIRIRRFRRNLGWLFVFAPVLYVLINDFARRAGQIWRFEWWQDEKASHAFSYLGSVPESAAFWGILMYTASRRRGLVAILTAPLFLALFTIVIGTEHAFHAFWNTYLSIDGQLHSKSIPWSIVGTLPLSRPIVIFHFALAAAVAVLLLRGGRRFIRPDLWGRRLVPIFVPVVLIGVTQIPVSYRRYQATLPDMIYFHGMTALVREELGYTNDSPDLRVQKRDPETVPTLRSEPKRRRNVIMILQESLRADICCVEYSADCDLANRFSNHAAPNRMPLLQTRAHDSTTAISISNLWTGVRPTETRELLHKVPLIWQYAAAAGWDTAYWTSQNLMFGNARLYVQDIPATRFAVATHLDREAPLDEGCLDSLVTERAEKELPELKEPFFAVVHYSNVHFPYVYNPEHAPFQPAEFSKEPEKNEHYRNYYKDVAYFSDMTVGHLIDFVRSQDFGERTVIVYTADHGESFREHWQMGHTSALYDEEIQVPTWIDAPPGTLAPEEEASIRKAKHELVWHLDITPTFLDLMGVWDDPALAPFRARMMGHPLTRPERTIEAVPLTNCTWVWECQFRNWGMMQGPMKMEAREWDGEFHCFNVLEDPSELTNLGEGACAPMPELARQIFHAMPNITPPGRPIVNWGK